MILSSLMGLAVIFFTGKHYLKTKIEKKDTLFLIKFMDDIFYFPKKLSHYVLMAFNTFSVQVKQHLEQGFFLKGIESLNVQILKLKALFSQLQNGNFQSYVLYFIIGLIFFLILVFLK